ncbi:MAG: pyruvate ferredoxin oxidoreductase [Gammaproteobacteria bacterium]|nr:pyruvate ferredoxin oxidoreductase [Gammaproteobacteria bacterium]MCP4879902.1 pyruvate ferredoxin oxidoreductase [Gammaproteobacteria bacterium]MDP6165441.1 transketolase C-terminal domain-containing protein [Gammaproteobacteria bacterium]
MTTNNDGTLLSGNHAVAWGVKLARPDVAPLYPITPQTPILEKIIELQDKGLMTVELLTPESEHSAMAAAIAASLTGARVFSATSSQGLLLMHELLHYAAGARAPIVLFNVNRTPASPWGFWPDQLDSLAQRDTGWIQLYSETPQESLDTTIMAFAIAEAANIPVMVNHDAFYVSHAVEAVRIPDQQWVDQFLPPLQLEHKLDTQTGRSFGAPIDQAAWNRSRREMCDAMTKVESLVSQTGQRWGALCGRNYGPLEHYRTAQADVLIVTMGSMCGTVREAVDEMRQQGQSVGLIKVRLFRPLPGAALREALVGVSTVLVLDRNYSPGMGGILHQELKSALFGMEKAPQIHGLLAGVGGVNVAAEHIQRWVSQYAQAEACVDSIWVE